MGAASAQPAAALSADSAQKILIGNWRVFGESETWTFTDNGEWTMYYGGKTMVLKYKLESMPANLFKLTPGNSTPYIVHTDATQKSMKFFKEGGDVEDGIWINKIIEGEASN